MKKLLVISLLFSAICYSQEIRYLPTVTVAASADWLLLDKAAQIPGSTKKITVGNLLLSFPQLQGWSLLGNAGTSNANNFIGTTDDIPFNIRVNNQKAGRIDHLLGNSFFGYFAGAVNTTGYYNTAIGGSALGNNFTGIQNTATGVDALGNNQTGNNNTANGYRALRFSITGHSNTAMGVSSLFDNTTGHSNTANGMNTLRFNNTGVSNTANGITSLYSNTIGNNNLALGGSALYSNVTGSNAVAIGFKAMYFSNSTATPFTNNSTAVGYEALMGGANATLNTGTANTAIGYQSLIENTTGSDNTATGNEALATNTTGSRNTALGFGADVLSGGLTNASAIGYNAKAGASNTLILGGTGGNAVRVGVGVTTPNAVALLDLTSTTRGLLLPRMTTAQRQAIVAVAGLVVYDITLNAIFCYTTVWTQL